MNEQLPSVSQLLTPAPHDSRPSSPFPTTVFGIYTGADSPHPSIHNESGPSPGFQRNGVHDLSRVPSDLGSQSGSLPPLAQISTLGLRDGQANAHNPAHYPIHSSQYGHSVLHGGRVHERDSEDEGFPTEMAEFGEPAGKKAKTKVRPHVVDERYIDGEGLCYIYADGSHCPKVIDGVPVNANWGITKAGKPRKRLAQACLTCREKKIKCQPNLPKCDQCQKSGRECRFESA